MTRFICRKNRRMIKIRHIKMTKKESEWFRTMVLNLLWFVAPLYRLNTSGPLVFKKLKAWNFPRFLVLFKKQNLHSLKS